MIIPLEYHMPDVLIRLCLTCLQEFSLKIILLKIIIASYQSRGHMILAVSSKWVYVFCIPTGTRNTYQLEILYSIKRFKQNLRSKWVL